MTNMSDVVKPDPSFFEALAAALGFDTETIEAISAGLAGKQDINTTIPLTQKGVANGVAQLNGSGLVPDGQISSTIVRETELLDGLATKETPSGAQSKADAKVADAISDGVTNVAPSQNAVFDALAGKQDVGTSVQKTGDETIAGVKSFANVVVKDSPTDIRHPDFGGVDMTGVANGSAALQGAIDYVAASGGKVLIPAGDLLIQTPIVVSHHSTHIEGQGQKATRLHADVGIGNDALLYTNAIVGAYINDCSISKLSLDAKTRYLSVRDLLSLLGPGSFKASSLYLSGAGRYDAKVDFCIETMFEHVMHDKAGVSPFWLGSTTSTSTSFEAIGCTFRESQDGPGADIKSLGAVFVACVFESNRAATTPANGHGAQVRSGYATFSGCYWENNAAFDLIAGTDSTTHLVVNGFHALTGGYSLARAAGGGHLKLDQFIASAALNGGKYDTRAPSIIIHPSVRNVFGGGMRVNPNPPEMTDGSDIYAAPIGVIWNIDQATGELFPYGRADSKVRNSYVTGKLELPAGLAATPALRFTSDPDSGLISVGPNRVGIVAGGLLNFDATDTYFRSIFPVRVPDGTAAAPAIVPNSDQNTGIFSQAADALGFAIGGVEGARLSAPADTETAMSIRRNVGGAFTLQRVSMGAADSGGAGFKLLRVPN